jgi:hypothetical protein
MSGNYSSGVDGAKSEDTDPELLRRWLGVLRPGWPQAFPGMRKFLRAGVSTLMSKSTGLLVDSGDSLSERQAVTCAIAGMAARTRSGRSRSLEQRQVYVDRPQQPHGAEDDESCYELF